MTRSRIAFACQTATWADELHLFRNRADRGMGIILPVRNSPDLLDFLRLTSE
jgi:hypothetical protein